MVNIKAIAILAGLILAGCTYQRTDVRTAAVDEQLVPPQRNYDSGSLWQDSSAGLTEDFKAHRRGDIITIIVSEQSSASKQANTGTKRESSVSAGMPNILGIENYNLSSSLDLSKLLNASYASKYDGSGSTSRNENLKATITAKVTDVLANGNLRIRGERTVTVNNEDQLIVLDGTVRPRDITPDNMVNSIYIADARISYTGKGVLSDRQKPGWLMNFLEKLWPF